MDLIRSIEKEQATKTEIPSFRAGDTLRVQLKVIEVKEDKKVVERLQAFEGICIQRSNTGINETMTIRKISHGVGVERSLLINSPRVASIEVLRRGDVSKARLYYLRDKIGKKARVKERKTAKPGAKS